jgi:hypothetical protein
MIRIAITVEAHEALAATLPPGTAAYELEPNAKGERLFWLQEVWLSKLKRRAQAGPRSPAPSAVSFLRRRPARCRRRRYPAAP